MIQQVSIVEEDTGFEGKSGFEEDKLSFVEVDIELDWIEVGRFVVGCFEEDKFVVRYFEVGTGCVVEDSQGEVE